MNKKLLHVVTDILLVYYAFIAFMVISGSSIINQSELLGEKLNMLLNLTLVIAIIYAIYVVKYIVEISSFRHRTTPLPILIILTIVAILIGFIVFHDVSKSDEAGTPYYSDDYIDMVDKAQVFATGYAITGSDPSLEYDALYELYKNDKLISNPSKYKCKVYVDNILTDDVYVSGYANTVDGSFMQFKSISDAIIINYPCIYIYPDRITKLNHISLDEYVNDFIDTYE